MLNKVGQERMFLPLIYYIDIFFDSINCRLGIDQDGFYICWVYDSKIIETIANVLDPKDFIGDKE